MVLNRRVEWIVKFNARNVQKEGEEEGTVEATYHDL